MIEKRESMEIDFDTVNKSIELASLIWMYFLKLIIESFWKKIINLFNEKVIEMTCGMNTR